MQGNFSIGLDLGTNSVGWSVIKNDYKLVKKGNKSLWGVVVFEEGNTAQQRRLFRSSRRRLERRRERIELLRSLIAKTMQAVDPEFFQRLDSSFLANSFNDPITGRNYRYNLFNGAYTDKEFYKKYKTIYHLRKDLMERKEKVDIRLVYLALHHIIKYRGNFLHEEDNIIASGAGVKGRLENVLSEHVGVLNGFSIDLDKYCEVLLSKGITRRDKSKQLSQISGNNVLSQAIANLLSGLKCDLGKILNIEDVKSIQFGTDAFESAMIENTEKLGNELTDFIYALNGVYSEIVFVNILGEGNTTVSDAMIYKYNKHKQDLSLLKKILKPYPVLFNKMFKSSRKGVLDKNASYTNYVGTNTKRTRYGTKKSSREDFYKFVKAILNEIPDSSEKDKILSDIALEEFMPKINDVENSAIPYQINKNELIAILANQSVFYPEIAENSEKIVKLLTFRRPYSVGVLKGDRFSWIDQKIEEKIYPWNFEELVDYTQANANFIARMVTRDEFTGEQVLPLQSITYQRFNVLNELNNLRYKDKPLAVETKQRIYNECVLQKASVSKKDIMHFINNLPNMSCKLEDLSGFADKEKLISNMKTYREFKTIFGEEFNDANMSLYDDIVRILTVFKDSKSKRTMLERIVKNPIIVEKLLKKSYAGWGRYSFGLLNNVYSKESNPRNILTLMYETNKNFMSIVYDQEYGIKEQTVGKEKDKKNLNYIELIEPLFASPAVKKAVWQACKLVDEIIKIMGGKPQNIFIESTRTTQEKKASFNRYYILKDLYKKIDADVQEYNLTQINALLEANKDNRALNSEKVYLYMLQMGRCMYTNEPLCFDRLNEYEVDHIVPRCYIKDDSLDNKVLVKKSENQRKSDLAISHATVEKMHPFWTFLYEHKFISKKKYQNLHKTEWTERDMEGFVNRQLTETNQINQCTKDVLLSVYPEINVQPVKSGIVSEFRRMHTDRDSQKYGEFYKLRSLNDYHHAKDAYLVACIGNFVKDHFSTWGNTTGALIMKRIIESGVDEKRVRELVNKRYGIIVDAMVSGEYNCVDEYGEVISSIVAYNNLLTVMNRNNPSVVIKKEFSGETDFYDQTIWSGKYSGKSNLIPRKSITDKEGNVIPLDPQLYGGYSGEKQAYYVNIRYKKSKKTLEKLVGVPSMVAKQHENGDSDAILRHIRKDYPSAEVIGKPVYKKQLIKMNGQYVTIASATEVNNATQLVIDKKYHKLLKLIENKNYSKVSELDNIEDLFDSLLCEYVEKVNKHYPLFSTIGESVDAFAKEGFKNLDIESKCKYIANLLVITSRGAGRVDMKAWNGGSSWGRMSGKTIIPSDVDWIDQSITGYYVQTITADV